MNAGCLVNYKNIKREQLLIYFSYICRLEQISTSKNDE